MNLCSWTFTVHEHVIHEHVEFMNGHFMLMHVSWTYAYELFMGNSWTVHDILAGELGSVVFNRISFVCNLHCGNPNKKHMHYNIHTYKWILYCVLCQVRRARCSPDIPVCCIQASCGDIGEFPTRLPTGNELTDFSRDDIIERGKKTVSWICWIITPVAS